MAEIKTKKGQVILVDDDDVPSLSNYTWHIERNGYACTNMRDESVPSKYRTVKMHRMIMGFELKDRRYVDHINGNRIDNRKENLREVSNQQNLCNRGKTSGNKSGYKGVSWHAVTGKWVASIGFKYETIHLGCFDTKEEARAGYEVAAKLLHGEYANFDRLVESGKLEVVK